MENSRDTCFLLALAAAACISVVTVARHLNQPETVDSIAREVALHPRDAGLHERLGNALQRAGRNDEAFSEFKSAVALDPQNETAPYSLAALYAARGNEKDAQTVLSVNLHNHPDDAPSNELLAELVVQSLGEEIAVPIIRKNYETALHADPTRAAAAVAISKLRVADGDVEGALKVLEKPLLAHPRDPAVHLQMAAVLTKQQHFGAANEQFNTGTVLDPKNARAYCDWGAMLIDFERPAAATEVLQVAINLDGKSARAHMEMGQALMDLALDNQGNMEDARKEFAKALDLDSTFVPTYIAWARMMLVQRNERAALNFLKDAVTINPDDAPAQEMLAKILLTADDRSLRDPAAGLQALGEAVRATHFKDLNLLIGYAGALASAGYYDPAADILGRAMLLPGVSDGQKETIAAKRQDYAIATIPENAGPRSVLDPGALDNEPASDYPAWEMPRVAAGKVLQITGETAFGRPLPGTWDHPLLASPGAEKAPGPGPKP